MVMATMVLAIQWFTCILCARTAPPKLSQIPNSPTFAGSQKMSNEGVKRCTGGQFQMVSTWLDDRHIYALCTNKVLITGK